MSSLDNVKVGDTVLLSVGGVGRNRGYYRREVTRVTAQYFWIKPGAGRVSKRTGRVHGSEYDYVEPYIPSKHLELVVATQREIQISLLKQDIEYRGFRKDLTLAQIKELRELLISKYLTNSR